MSDLSPTTLRTLILNFYSEHDPIKLQQGLDVNGIVEWTMKNGIKKLNEMLLKQFGEVIDVNQARATAQQSFYRMSAALTPQMFKNTQSLSMDLSAKQMAITKKLKEFYRKHDESRLGPANRDQFDRIVAFAVYHGVEKLNAKLEKKYGEGLPMDSALAGARPVTNVLDAPGGYVNEKYEVRKDEINIDRLEDDLRAYFEEKHVMDHLEVIDQVLEWVLRIGFEEFNAKSEQMYGERFDDVLIAIGRQPYVKEKVQNTNVVPKLPAFGQMGRQDSAFTEVQGDFIESVEGRDFDKMLDSEILEELRAYYNHYDPQNLPKLNDVLDLARKFGRKGLNERLEGIYGDTLHPDLIYDDEEEPQYSFNEPDNFDTLDNMERESFRRVMPDTRASPSPAPAGPPPMPPRNAGSQEMWEEPTPAVHPNANRPLPAPPGAVANVMATSKRTKQGLSARFKGMLTGKKKKNQDASPSPMIVAEEPAAISPMLMSEPFPQTPAAISPMPMGEPFPQSPAPNYPPRQQTPPPVQDPVSPQRRQLPGMTALPGLAVPMPMKPAATSFTNFNTGQSNGQSIPGEYSSGMGMGTRNDSFSSFTSGITSGYTGPSNSASRTRQKIMNNGGATFGGTGGSDISEIVRKAKEMKARNTRGESIVTGFDGKKEVINLLQDCDQYLLDIISGVCSNCGLAKNQHATKAKKLQVNAGLNDVRQNGKVNVSALISRVNKKVNNKQIHKKKVPNTGKKFGPAGQQRYLPPPPSTNLIQNLKTTRKPGGRDQFETLTSDSLRFSWNQKI